MRTEAANAVILNRPDKNMLARLNKLDTPTKVLYGVSALLMVVGAALSLLTHPKTVELAAGPASCNVDAAHYAALADGSVTILKGAVVECDRYISNPASMRFTIKKTG